MSTNHQANRTPSGIRAFWVRIAAVVSLFAAVVAVPAAAAETPKAPATPGSLSAVCQAQFQFDFGAPDYLAAHGLASIAMCLPGSNFPENISAATVQTTTATATACPQLTINGTGVFTWTRRDLTQFTDDFTFAVNLNLINGPINLSATMTSGPLNGGTVAVAAPLTALVDEVVTCPGGLPVNIGFKRFAVLNALLTVTV